jgi:hypothetical protein
LSIVRASRHGRFVFSYSSAFTPSFNSPILDCNTNRQNNPLDVGPALLDNNDMVLKRDKARFSEAMWNLLNMVLNSQRKEELFLPARKKLIIPFYHNCQS